MNFCGCPDFQNFARINIFNILKLKKEDNLCKREKKCTKNVFLVPI